MKLEKDCLLNKTEIGQLFKIKYKVGMKNKIDQIRGALFIEVKEIISAIKLAIKMVSLIYLGLESFKDLPFLSKKPYFSTKFTSWAILIKEGTSIIVKKAIIIEYLLKIIPTLIPSANIKFQKLSLLSRDWIKVVLKRLAIMTITIFEMIIIILTLSQINKIAKKISVCGIVIIFSFPIHCCLAGDFKTLISQKELKYNIPTGLLESVAKIESNYQPYALNISGRSLILEDLNEAANIIDQYLAKGVRNIDIGIMQINWRWHGHNFKNVKEMLSPEHNIEYAAKLLLKLYQQYGSWHFAVRHYHSSNIVRQSIYSNKVLLSWLG